MKIFICASKHIYDKIPPIRSQLERMGHEITLPNSYDDPLKEERIKKVSKKDHAEWKASMISLQEKKVEENDAVLIVNFEKNGQANYIGGATFLEMYIAFRLNKPVYMMNPFPENILKDEIAAFSPVVLNGDLSKIRQV